MNNKLNRLKLIINYNNYLALIIIERININIIAKIRKLNNLKSLSLINNQII